ncbi:uncharacterized protein LOC114362686 [Ostrinia furnacalis]|uniref:uncharacterized protein LOC114362686 n=1 Tax=Ostrinia furnacalis TaxID=93504 RepID=UPI001039E10B|nr:uncharacterized protein LOC114362686 [Ostrinia furnacalis]
MSVCELEASPEACGGVTTPTSYVFARDKSVTTDDFNKFKEEIREMVQSMLSTHNELKTITPTLVAIQQTNLNIESSIAFLTSQNAELKNKIEQFETQSKKDREHIAMLEDRVEELQRNYRKNNLEIKNVPKTKDETRDSLVNMVSTLSKNIGCNVLKSDIKDIYRIKSSRSDAKNTSIIIETTSTLIKNDFLKMCKSHNVKRKEKLCAKHLGFTTNEDTPIFISEQLTVKGSRLFFLARDLAKTKSYKFCWTSFGKVYVRKDDNTPIILIKNESQVHHLLHGA